MIWLVFVVICAAAALGVSFPLLRRYGPDVAPIQETAVYQDQLEEVERDLNSGSINAPEAQAAKSEINRRLEIANREAKPARPLNQFWRRTTLMVVAALVVAGGFGLYAFLGSPNMPSGTPQAQQAPVSIDAMIAQIKTRLKQKPDDVEGWRLLGLANFTQKRWPESIFAYGKAVELAPDNIDLRSTLAEAEIRAAQGKVTPEAQAQIDAVLAKDPKDLRSLFYDGLGHEQAGDKQGALDRWTNLLAIAPADAPWRADMSQHVADLAKALGKDVPSVAQAPAPASGQQAMIEAMVQKQADSLKANPKDLDGWLRLIRSYTVLKSPEKAKAALQSAKQAFDADQGSLAKLQAIADELGIN